MKVYKEGGRYLFLNDEETTKYVSELLLDFEKGGMDAIRKFNQGRGSWAPENYELTPAQIKAAESQVSDQTKEDIAYSQANVRKFAEAAMEMFHPIDTEIRPGVFLGYRHHPVNVVGGYVPGGTFPLFGSAQMCIIPAKVAGVKHITACTPALREDPSDLPCFPESIYAMSQAGADQIFLLGGVPAIAMMAFGMGVTKPSDVLCGAGNKYVEEAKRQLYGRCGIDLLAGPSEILVIADGTVGPEIAAADILSQAEHDVNAGICLICFSEDYATACEKEIEKQLETLPTASIASVSWKNNGRVLIAESKEEAVELADEYGPEHLEVLTDEKNGEYFLAHLSSYGELYIGPATTVAYGDKSAGTNHILPTGNAARYTGGVWVGNFLRTNTYLKATPEGSAPLGRVVKRLCDIEMMPGHAIASQIRVDTYGKE